MKLALRPPSVSDAAMAAGALAVLVGGIVLTGWALDIAALKSVLPGWVSMKPNTAVAFILTGLSFLLSRPPPTTEESQTLTSRAHLARLFGMLAGLIGLLSLAEYAFGWNPGFDQWLFAEPLGTVGTSSPGRMAPDTATCFVLLAAGLELMQRPRESAKTRTAAMIVGALVAFIGLTEILSFLAPGFRTYGWSGLTMMALPTAVVFGVLGATLIAMAARRRTSAPDRPAGPADALGVKVRLRLSLVFVVLSAGITTAGALYYRSIERDFRLGVERELAAIADLKVSQVASWRAERLGDGRSSFQNRAFFLLVRRLLAQSADADARSLLLEWLGKFGSTYGYDEIRLLDARGATRLSIPANVAPTAISTQRAAADVVQSGRVAFQDLYRNDRDSLVYLQLLVPVLDEQDANRPLGVVSLRINPTRNLYPYIQTWPVPSGSAETLIIRRDGNDVLFLNALRFRPDAALALRIPLSRHDVASVNAVLGQTGIMTGVDYRDVPVVSALRAIPDSPWFLVAKLDVVEAYAPLRGRLWQVIVVVGLFLVGAGASVGLIWWQAQLRLTSERQAIDWDRARLGAIVESSEDAIISNDLDGIITSWNRGAERVYGYRAEEVVGKPIGLLIPPELGNDETDLMATIRRGESVGHRETSRLRKDGQRVQVSLSVSPIESATGMIEGASVIGRDITDRKQAEQLSQALRASEDDYRILFREMLSGFALHEIICDEAGNPSDYRFLAVNPAFERMTGLKAAETVGRTVSEILPDTERSWIERYGKVALTGEPVCFENYAASLNRHFEVAAFRPKMKQFVCLFSDITERKQAELQLANQTEQVAKANEELTRFNRLMSGRELRVVELKQQVNDLAVQLGQARPYPLAFLDAAATEVVRTTPKPDEQDSSIPESPQGTSP